MVSLRRKRNAAAAAAAAEEAAAAAAVAAAAAAAAQEAAAIIQRDEVLHQIKRLRRIQEELEKVNEEERDEILEIKKKHIGKRKPMYTRRNQIINEIPCFWLTAFMHNRTLANLLEEDDQKIFCYLEAINVEDCSDPRMGYYITFSFRENPFFYNRLLTKTINIMADGAIWSNATHIYWKGCRQRSLPAESFFTWFCSRGEDIAEEKKKLVAKIIKDELWPKPIDCRLLTILDDEVDIGDA